MLKCTLPFGIDLVSIFHLQLQWTENVSHISAFSPIFFHFLVIFFSVHLHTYLHRFVLLFRFFFIHFNAVFRVNYLFKMSSRTKLKNLDSNLKWLRVRRRAEVKEIWHSIANLFMSLSILSLSLSLLTFFNLHFKLQRPNFPILYCNLCCNHIVNSLAFANANPLNKLQSIRTPQNVYSYLCDFENCFCLR